MRSLRTGDFTPKVEWSASDLAEHLGCSYDEADKIMQEYRDKNNIKGYCYIERDIILSFIEEKRQAQQRAERESQARHQAHLSIAKMSGSLEEQVKLLREQVNTLNEQNIILQNQIQTLRENYDASSMEARKSYTQSIIANLISGASAIIAIIALVLAIVRG